jgi:penicillin-binding protein 1C
VAQNVTGGRRVSGASTLAMQVARMQHPGARSWLHKLEEAATAWLLTTGYGREAVLRQYLTLVPYGNRIHGIAYAARRYLDEPVADLSWAEIAFLAAIPQSPAHSNPYQPDGYRRAVERGRRLLRQLADDGVLDAATLRTADAQIQTLTVPWLERRPVEALHFLLRIDRELAREKPATPRSIVRSSLDLDLQKEATWIAWQSVGAWSKRGAGNAALLVLDAKTAEVLAYVGSADYFDATRSGSIDYAQIPRSAGSTLKPFLYALALDRGTITAATVLDDLARGPGGITNADGRFLGPLLPRVALANSRNVPAVELLQRLGLDEGYGLFRQLGLHDDAERAERYGLGLAIGGLPVTLEQLTHAYTALAGGGSLRALRWYDGEPATPSRAVLSEDSTRQVARFLSDPLARLPSFPRMGTSEFPFPVAIKTGTSSGFRDAWAAAWTPRYVVAAWVGNAEFRPMNRLSGYRSAAELVQQVLLKLHAPERDGLSDVGFPAPRGAEEVRVCALTGQRATAACDRVFLEAFAPGTAPTESCTAHRQRVVDRRNGLLATRATPVAEREVRTFVDLPPRYAEWLATTVLPREPRRVSDLDAPAPAESLAARPGGERPVALRITSPENGTTLLRDPETPNGLETLALRAVIDPPAAQVVWYVDGRPFEVADRPYAARWPIAPGDHVFQVRLPYTTLASSPVRVRVE